MGRMTVTRMEHVREDLERIARRLSGEDVALNTRAGLYALAVAADAGRRILALEAALSEAIRVLGDAADVIDEDGFGGDPEEMKDERARIVRLAKVLGEYQPPRWSWNENAGDVTTKLAGSPLHAKLWEAINDFAVGGRRHELVNEIEEALRDIVRAGPAFDRNGELVLPALPPPAGDVYGAGAGEPAHMMVNCPTFIQAKHRKPGVACALCNEPRHAHPVRKP